MRATKHWLSSVLLAISVPALAAPTVLSFEDAPAVATRVLDSYSALGIHFSSDAWAAMSKGVLNSAYGNFYAAPGDFGSNKGAVTLTSNAYPQAGEAPPTGSNFFTISVEHGFDGFFSLRYTGEAAMTITAYDKNGDALGLPVGGDGTLTTGCATNFACNWSLRTLQLDAAAYSIKIEGTNGKQWFDDFSFGRLLADEQGGTVPEPGGVALSLAALGALALGRRRSKT